MSDHPFTCICMECIPPKPSPAPVDSVAAKLMAMRTMCEACGQPFYVKLLDEVLAALTDTGEQMLHVVFDGPPGPDGGRFVECETPDGRSVNAGEWHERDDGLWELRVNLAASRSVSVSGAKEGIMQAMRALGSIDRVCSETLAALTDTGETCKHCGMNASGHEPSGSCGDGGGSTFDTGEEPSEAMIEAGEEVYGRSHFGKSKRVVRAIYLAMRAAGKGTQE